jgi:hypothetical protein
LVLYLVTAYTNPGYLIGNEQVQIAKAQKNLDNQQKEAAAAQESQAASGSIFTTESNPQLAAGLHSHKRQKSVLQRDLISRHDR